MIELNVQDLRKKALIKFSGAPDGHVFAVRKQTPGDELALSEVYREKAKLIEEASEVEKELKDDSKKTDINIANSKIEKIIDKISELEKKELSIRIRVFDDMSDGELSRRLYLELTEDERNTLIESVVNNKNIVENNG